MSSIDCKSDRKANPQKRTHKWCCAYYTKKTAHITNGNSEFAGDYLAAKLPQLKLPIRGITVSPLTVDGMLSFYRDISTNLNGVWSPRGKPIENLYVTAYFRQALGYRAQNEDKGELAAVINRLLNPPPGEDIPVGIIFEKQSTRGRGHFLHKHLSRLAKEEISRIDRMRIIRA